MSNLISKYMGDWKEKRASALDSVPPEGQMAEVFAQQAETLISNKLGDLMTSEHRLGFEVIKADDDYTRMIGIFAFKAGGDLIFAPVFFSNGDIKGTDLLYRNSTKTFVPATKEWAEFLIEKGDVNDGRGINKEERSKNPPLVDMRRIAFLPPGYRQGVKMASAKGCECGDKECDCTKGEVKIDEKSYSEEEVSEEARKNLMGDGQNRKMSDGTSFLEPPSFMEKQAFRQLVRSTKYQDVVDDLVKSAMECDYSEKPGMLKNLLEDSPHAPAMFEALCKAAELDPRFAEGLARCYPDPTVLGNAVQFSQDMFSKKASKEPECLLHVHFQELEQGVKMASERGDRVFTDGFFLSDKRPMESMGVVVEDASTEVQTIGSSPGLYDMLTVNSGVVRGIAAPRYFGPKLGSDNFHESGNRYLGSSETSLGSSVWNGAPVTDSVVDVIIDGKLAEGRRLVGSFVSSAAAVPEAKEEVEEKKSYMILLESDESGSFLGPVYIGEKKKVGGVWHYLMTMPNTDSGWVRESFNVSGDARWILHNRDLSKNDLPRGILGKNVRFFELKVSVDPYNRGRRQDEAVIRDGEFFYRGNAEKAPVIMDERAINQFVESTDIRTIAARKTLDGNYDLKDEDYTMEEVPKVKAASILAAEFLIPGHKALEILDKADERGYYQVNVVPTASMPKIASRLRLVDQENFYDTFDSQFGIDVRPVQSVALRTTISDPFEAPARIGDASNPMSANGLPPTVVLQTPPSQLKGMADKYQLPHVFEHGTVGVLSNTFDCIAAMEKYLPDLEKGVDAKGRILFLFYVKPSDFEEAYGVDDMSNIENKLISDFKQDGEMFLDLSRRTIDRQKGVSKKPVEE